ncbi:hypothetical protein F9L33_09460 [Amylibacter sp. SFDW26]|uniref:flagellar biosynthesis protein FlhA n=1 Tax=Amylibacter sp. SFDW26 TaxID=2652722 RepID=UPI0012623F05|nr:flagellar biosynthesis protein FlhA [Amylibacter sp. SFDW26]KAB7613597.1 hypothetical protein F9L33_09460 [Amylibacter sp. SFDW26]
MFRKDLALVSLIIAILALMVIPLNQQILDVLITVNISLAILLLMVAIYLRNPSDFSTFPSVILIGTAFRLALSIGTTRLILSEADGGQIIETFGDFVVSGSVAIGLVIFLIITVVQFLVVTKGAERVAEVGARFALDSMPGKQMSIDADLRAGNIEQEEANLKRTRLDKDSQFFGAMDGAMKFVKGDAIAGLIIIMINLIGGIAVGVTIHGLSFGGAVSVYSLLTIGDGLVAQIPALIMSLCAGMIVTRAANDENADLGSDIFKELIADYRVPGIASVVIFGMAFVPGFPRMIFIAVAVTLLVASFGLRKTHEIKEAEQAKSLKEAEAKEKKAEEKASVGEPSDRLVCQISKDLSDRINIKALQSDLNNMFSDLNVSRGITFPIAGIAVSETLHTGRVSIELDGVPIHKREIPVGMFMVAGDQDTVSLMGATEQEVKKETWLDTPILWVNDSYISAANNLKIDTYNLEYKLAELIFRTYEQHLGALFSKREFDTIYEIASKQDSESVKALEESLSKPVIFQILRYLIEDGVPLKPLRLVIDSLTYWNQINEGAGPVLLAECLRGSMKRQLCHFIAGDNAVLGVAMVDPDLENLARHGLSEAKSSGSLSSLEGLIFEPEITDQLIGQFNKLQQTQNAENNQIAIVVSADLRRRLRSFLAVNRIHLPVLAPHELSPDVKTYPIELISIGNVGAQMIDDDYSESNVYSAIE